MTENEAIKDLDIIRFNPHWDDLVKEEYWQDLMDMAIKALEEVQQYRAIEKELKERYHANVDIPLLMQHFIETIFEGEKHEGFCILTNEDAKAWEEYQAIGTPEELRCKRDAEANNEKWAEKALNNVIEALEELQKYNEIGTPEECRAAMEKQTAKRPSCDSFDGLHFFPICPNCGGELDEDERESYCECGQKLDWSDVE